MRSDRKRQDVGETLALLSKCDLLRHLPPEQIEPLLDRVQEREVEAGEIVFRTGDPGDALYIVAHGGVEVLNGSDQRTLAELGDGQAFGEMALLSGGTRTATIRAKTDSAAARDRQGRFRQAAGRGSVPRRTGAQAEPRARHHQPARGDVNPALWVQMARESVDRLSRSEEHRLLQEAKAGKGAGLAIVFGNILDTIPGCLVIGAKFAGFESLSLTLILGMFLGGIPEAAASATMLRKAGYSDRTIFLLWSTVLAAGVVAAVAGKLFINGSESMAAVLAQAVAGGAILALVTHAMIPEALHKGGSGIVLPAVGGFLFALYLALVEAAPYRASAACDCGQCHASAGGSQTLPSTKLVDGPSGTAMSSGSVCSNPARVTARVQAQLDLHPLAIEDAGKAHQHPTLERRSAPCFTCAFAITAGFEHRTAS